MNSPFKTSVVEVSAAALFDESERERLLALPTSQPVCVIFEGDERTFPGFLFTLKRRFEVLYFALRLSRRTDIAGFAAQAPRWVLSELHPLPQSFDVRDAETLTCSEIKNLLEKLAEAGAGLNPLPYRDYRQTTSSTFPSPVSRWKCVTTGTPKLSVIVPTRNTADFLVNLLRHLYLQTLPRSEYEVLVIDDGGTDRSLEQVQALLGPLGSSIHFEYVECPRPVASEKLFRAGFCRNVGLERSRGTAVLFLDSDMLLPPEFLSDLLKELESADVIQCPRLHIRPEKSQIGTEIASLGEKDLYLEEPGYWGPFFATEDWQEIPHAWRYTCTYCLAVTKDALSKVGAFRPIFDSYGFEDTDLGYRLYKAGFRFRLWKRMTYHLTLPVHKSRYYQSIWVKQVLLAKTGKIFFLSTLDREVYDLFRIYMGGESRWRQSLYRIFKG